MKSAFVQSVFHTALHYWGKTHAPEIVPHAERTERNLACLRRAMEKASLRDVRSIQDRLGVSYSAMLTAVVLSLRKMPALTCEECSELAESLRWDQDCGEPVTAWVFPKAGKNEFRTVCQFGVKRTALQTQVSLVLNAKFSPDPFTFLRRGRGIEAAVDLLVSLADEYPWVVVADIKDFFKSVQGATLCKMLGLSPAIVTNSVLVGPAVPVCVQSINPYTSIPSVLDGAALPGIPAGSRASQVVANILLGWAVRQGCPLPVITYGDDIILVARSEKEARSLEKALVEALESHPAGPFRLKHCHVRHVRDGYSIPKYRLRQTAGGKMRVTPSPESFQRFEERIALMGIELDETEAEAAIFKAIPLWAAAFPKWQKNELSFVNLETTALRALWTGQDAARWASLNPIS